ncbi:MULTISPECIES: CoA transferase [unclassified Microbacterium]|uniref:CaiB/BaiF CoA transferase family protein n=1 Tax=unclassified Microbacterium TaxID=2609290 RepID=UPI00214BD587|nr:MULTISPECIES: CoA transferase [unclassified Microbacterium]MCR2785960.1 CoA transferase [Microbacterium sp. zg.B96]WIM17068.1 CoA transferase [Microbacterium sp. zg-B96]
MTRFCAELRWGIRKKVEGGVMGVSTGAGVSDPNESRRPLAGVNVVEFGQFIAGPGAAALLADLGASVVKVESLGGDSMRSSDPIQFGVYNKGKRSLALNLRDPRCAAAAEELALSADIVIQNLRPGAMERLGLGPQALRAKRPSLIYGSVSGFGDAGPSAGKPGFDIAAQAKSGMMAINGQPDGPPTRVGITIVDVTTAHVLAQGALAALLRRDRTGEGTTLNVSLLDVALHLQSPKFANFFASDVEPVPYGDGQQSGQAPSGIIQTRDGRIVMAAYLQPHWESFCKAIGRPELIAEERFASNALRFQHRSELMSVIQPFFSSHATSDVVDILTKANIVVAPVNGYRDVVKDADVLASGALIQMQDLDGALIGTIANPIRSADWGTPPTVAIARVGQHSEEVLSEISLSSLEVQEMLQDGVVRQPVFEPHVGY